MAEFTGERVIPGQVDADLWNEHTARYAFAARFAGGRRVLDAGCGSGYGAARLALSAASVLGVDLSPEAVEYARRHYGMPRLGLLQASCTELPLADASFDLVTAFEVIEHLADWPAFLQEMRRVTAPEGLFIVSTPNRAYYGASRGRAEPNPFHAHEFDYEEFRAELAKLFPHVSMALQNHVGGIVFQPVEKSTPAEAAVERGGGSPAEAHFFIAVCGFAGPVEIPTLVYVPKAANILRERELHIERLEGELAEKGQWLEEALEDRQKLVELFRQQTEELERQNRWAQELDAQLGAARKRIGDLQQELAEQQATARQMAAAYEAKVAELEEEARQRAEWALETERRLTGELEERGRDLAARIEELGKCVRLLDAAEATVEERTHWAQRLEEELKQAEAQLGAVRASRWVKLGRAVGLGPPLGNG